MGFFQRVSNNMAELKSSVDKLDQMTSTSGTYDSIIWGGNQTVSAGGSNSIFSQNTSTKSTYENKRLVEYTVKKGDTLNNIAKKYNVKLSELLEYNPQIKNANLININQKIFIPQPLVAHDSVRAAETKKSQKTEPAQNKETPKTSEDKATTTTYTVKKGDTLRSLIRDNIGLSEKVLKDANPDVNFKKLKAGQEIKLPQVKTLEDAYDYETSSELFQTAKNHIAQGTDKDYCARAVKSILIKDGILDYRPDCEHAYQMEEDLDNCDALQKIYVEREDIKNLPAGCVVIWGNVETAEDKANEKSQYAPFRKSGHIFITAGDGKEISDHAGRIITHQTHYAVYVPKKLTTEEREQKAIDARQDYKNSKIKTGEKQQKYLNAYINWAKAAIDDNNVSQDSLKRLEQLLIEVPENNKSASVKDLVAKCEELLPQVKAKIK